MLCCIAFAVLTAIVPFARAGFRVELNYNEGWNVYHAASLAAHHQLYPQRHGWTSNNYPMLSFVVAAQLEKLTHDFVFTGRVLSLIALVVSCILVGAIVRRLGGAREAAILAVFFCLALFCVAADDPTYVGVDDPQMLGQALAITGLWIYLCFRKNLAGIAAAALLFITALSVKHNLLAFPFAVLLDLLLSGRRRALWFGLCGAIFGSASLGLQVHYGGPYFLDELLAPRSYSIAHALKQCGVVFGPLLFPLGVSIATAYALRNHPQQRFASILLAASLGIGGYFAGGSGVCINAFFDAFLAIGVLIGLGFARMESGLLRIWRLGKSSFPLAVFGWFLIPWLLVPPLSDPPHTPENWFPPLALRHLAAQENRFDRDVALLRSQPGPALCESLLLCYYAGKPFVFDPFNATRFIALGRLDAQTMVAALRRHEYGAVQLNAPAERTLLEDGDRFAPPIVVAIEQNYRLRSQSKDGAIYLPDWAATGRTR